MPINVEINETQAQSNEVKIGQFRTDGEGTYGVVVESNEKFNFLVISDAINDYDTPYINYGVAYGNDIAESIALEMPYIVEGRIYIEGYRK